MIIGTNNVFEVGCCILCNNLREIIPNCLSVPNLLCRNCHNLSIKYFMYMYVYTHTHTLYIIDHLIIYVTCIMYIYK